MADLSGRDLDAAVARVLWLGGDIHHPEHPAYGRAYSTDYALFGEMLDWVHAPDRLNRPSRPWIDSDSGRDSPVHHWRIKWHEGRTGSFAARPSDCMDTEAFGATLPEAVARLVVAVGAKEKPNA